MVEFKLPEQMTQEYLSLIPSHKLKVKNYFDQNILQNYTLAYNLRKLWAIFTAKSKEEVHSYISELPLSQYMTYEIHELMFHETGSVITPTFSLN